MSQRAHSKYGGSTCSRWMACPGSVELCERVPSTPPTSYAEEGTLAHTLAEYCLCRGERDATVFAGPDVAHPWFKSAEQRHVISQEMAEAVNVYLAAVYAEVDASPDAELYVEERFVLDVASALPGEVFGRNDAMVYSRSRMRLVAFDYKHGAGVSVQAEGNKQGLFYASGALLSHDWPIEEVEVVIVQPRSSDAGEDHGGVKRWTFSPVDVLDFVGEIEAAIGRAREPGAPLAEGAHCRWCSAQPICPLKRQALAAAFNQVDIAELDVKALPEPRALEPAELGKLLAAFEKLDSFRKSVEELAFGLASGGSEIPGWKLVEKMPRRKWQAADDEIASYIAVNYGVDYADLMPPKLVGITEAERLVTATLGGAKNARAAKDDITLKFTVKESSGLTLAPAYDKRDAVNKAAAFSGVDVPAE